MLHLSRVDFVRYFVKRQVPNPFHRASVTCRRQVRPERSCLQDARLRQDRGLCQLRNLHTLLCVLSLFGDNPLEEAKGNSLVFDTHSALSPLLLGSGKVARRSLGAVDPTCQLVLRCSAPSNCQEFGTSGHLSHLPSLCGLLLL